MKPKTTLLLAVVLVVLGGIAILTTRSSHKSLAPEGKPVFKDFDAEMVDGITIDGKGRTVDLRKKATGWVVASDGDHEADPKPPEQILEAMKGFTTTARVSTSPERQAAFEVDSTGIMVRLKEGDKTVAQFMVGKPGPDYMSAYVRPVPGNDVYLIPSYLRSVVDRGDETWRNLNVLSLDAANILSFKARNEKTTIAAEKDASGSWQLTEPSPGRAKTDMIGMVLRSLAQFRASGFADSSITPTEVGLIPDTTRIEVRTSDGTLYGLTVGTMNDKRQSYVQKDGDPTIYLVPRGRINTIFRDPEMLKEPEPEPPPPAPDTTAEPDSGASMHSESVPATKTPGS